MRHVLTIFAVENVEPTAAFWEQALAARRSVDVPVYVELTLQCGMRLGLYQRDGFGQNTGEVPAAVPTGALRPTEIYFHTTDLDAAIARLEAAGGRLLSARAVRPWGDEAAYFAGPEGNVMVVATTTT